jgi:hypothetical protein
MLAQTVTHFLAEYTKKREVKGKGKGMRSTEERILEYGSVGGFE